MSLKNCNLSAIFNGRHFGFVQSHNLVNPFTNSLSVFLLILCSATDEFSALCFLVYWIFVITPHLHHFGGSFKFPCPVFVARCLLLGKLLFFSYFLFYSMCLNYCWSTPDSLIVFPCCLLLFTPHNQLFMSPISVHKLSCQFLCLVLCYPCMLCIPRIFVFTTLVLWPFILSPCASINSKSLNFVFCFHIITNVGFLFLCSQKLMVAEELYSKTEGIIF